MYEGDITFLMEYCQRDLGYAQGLIVKGDYAKSIGESYYAVFYAAKAGLLHLGIRSKSHQSVQAGIDSIVERDSVSCLGKRTRNTLEHAQRGGLSLCKT